MRGELSGKDNHFVPIFLQSGFLSRTAGKKRFTWRFLSNDEPREISVRDWGKKHKFYWRGNDASVDDHLTNVQEREAVRILNDVRASPEKTTDPKAAAELISHFEIRSQAMRVRVEAEFERTLSQLSHACSDPEILRQILIAELSANSRHVAAFLESNRIPPFLQPHVRTVIADRLRAVSPSTIQYLISDRIPSLANVIPEALRAVKEAQLRVIENLKQGERYDKLASLNYQVITLPEGIEACLADCMVVYKMEQGEFRGILQSIKQTLWVALPVSHNRVLIGTAGGPPPDIEEVNRPSASVSHNGFIAKRNDPTMRDLSKIIGTQAFSISEKESSAIVRSVLIGFLAGAQKT